MKEYDHIVGHRFPGATYTLPEWMCWLWSDTAQLKPDRQTAHPALAYFVAMQGTGVSIQDIFDLMDAGVDDGVLFGECELIWNGEMKSGATYECTAEVVKVERKSGRRAGVFDLMAFQIQMREPGATEVVATCTNTFVFPRKEDGQ
jgi:hypothetical protein